MSSGLAVVAGVWRAAGTGRGRLARGIAFRFAQSMSLGVSFAVVAWVLTVLREGPLAAGQVRLAVVLVVVSLVGQLGFGYLAVTDNWAASFAMVGRLRLAVLDHLRRLPMGFHLGRGQADTVTAVTSDMAMIETFASDAFPTVAQALGLPAAVLIALGIVDPPLAGAVAVSVVAAAPVLLWANRRMAALSRQRQDRQADAVARMLAYVQGIAVVRAFNLTGERQRRFREALEEFREISLRMVARLIVPVMVFASVLLLGIPLVIAAVGYWLLGGRIDATSALIALVLVLSVYAPLLALLSVMEVLRLADASMARFSRVAEAPVQPEPAEPLEPADAGLSFDRVSFGYLPGRPVLHEVSFTVPERSMTAIVGPSGSGKSTVLSLLARFWDVDSGAVRIGGVDVRSLGARRLYASVSVMFQDVYLFQGTIFDNIAFGRPETEPERVHAAAEAAQAHGFITALPDGYDTRVGEGGAALSGGERQRIAIARAILKDAPIVLLDEATSAIDPTNEKHVTEALANLVTDKTLLVVAHKLSTIRAADQVIALEHGRVAEVGSPAELITMGGVFARFHAQRERAQGWRLDTNRR
ncbi:ABC transporter ATP-binding protein [Pseudonocardia acaciae]|uniref:ABC transporter ATP-binding protein n=1 Tax=Pseudonocardia acaciae TaxID=551276 RepID=UPI00048F2760|nr:ABC transporter ATP-binding protein [Pseudonocardia acaciae]